MNFVPDKYGNEITTYKYDDWDEYITTCVLSKCLDNVVFTPIFEGKTEDDNSLMKRILDCLDNKDNKEATKETKTTETKTLEILESIISDDTYYILWVFEARILKAKIYDLVKYYKDHHYSDSCDLVRDIVDLRPDYYSPTRLNQLESLVNLIFRYDGSYLNDAVDDTIKCLIGNDDKISRSIITLTKNFENNPIKAFLRFNYFQKHHYYCRSYDMRYSVIEIYWIYFFFVSVDTDRFVNCVHFEDVDLSKITDKVEHFKPFSIGSHALKKIQERYQKQLDQLKEQHQKEIEELLAPGGAAYQAAKKRFEETREMLEENHDGLN